MIRPIPKDSTMEMLADKGNGNCAYIDTPNKGRHDLSFCHLGFLRADLKPSRIEETLRFMPVPRRTTNPFRIGVLAACLFFIISASLIQGADSPTLFVRSSTYASYANVLRIGISADGTEFTDLFTTPTLPDYSRDASITTFGNTYVVAYTDKFLSTNGTFGVSVSSNLVDWSAVSSPKAVSPSLITNMINNTWAPEWFVENGAYYVVVRVSLTTNSSPTTSDTLQAPGHGYMRCLDPGTWTNWTDFQPIGGFTNTSANDVAIAKFGNTYHLFYTDQGHLTVRKSTEGPFIGYGAASNISGPFEDVVDARERELGGYIYRLFPFEGPFVIHLGGDNYRLYFQNLINDRTWTIVSTNGMVSWETNSVQPVTYNGVPSFGHGSVRLISPADAMVPMAALVRRAETALAENSSIRTNPNAYNLYSFSQYQANRTAGQADVIAAPGSYNLYTSSSIMDLGMGGIMLQKNGTTVTVSLQLQTTTNLFTPFTNHGPPISLPPIEMPDDRAFLRVRAVP